MPKRRLSINLPNEDAMHVSRLTIGKMRLVYVIMANEELKHGNKWSKIAYIGTTKKGLSRIASSVAYRANEIPKLHGVRSFTVAIVSCRQRQRVRTWFRLERALLAKFKDLFGSVPVCNSKGTKMTPQGVWELFSEARAQQILDRLS